jgi:hypothetical protein
MATEIDKFYIPFGLKDQKTTINLESSGNNSDFGNPALPTPDFEFVAEATPHVWSYPAGNDHQVQSQVPTEQMLRRPDWLIESEVNGPGMGRRGAENTTSSTVYAGSDAAEIAFTPTSDFEIQSHG